MAILAIIDRDNTNADPVKDQRGCYKRGDIVAVHDDSKHDGDLIRNPVVAPWYLVRVTGVTAEQVQHALDPELSAVAFDEDGRPLRIRRRKFRVNVADIPAGARAQLQANRYIEVTVQQARNFIRNKITNEPL